MSELKWNWVYCPYLDAPDKQKESALKAGYTKVVRKSEADKVIARHKYKRCLAMAKWCYAKWDDTATKYYKSVWYRKWEVKWLELAEKFKEVK